MRYYLEGLGAGEREGAYWGSVGLLDVKMGMGLIAGCSLKNACR